MAPQDAVAWDFDAIVPALRDPDRRISQLKEVVRLKKRGHRLRTGPISAHHLDRAR